MRLTLLTVGRPSRQLAGALAEYEKRSRRYWRLSVVEIRSHRATTSLSVEAVIGRESASLLRRVPVDAQVIALTRSGEAWCSARLAAYLNDLALSGAPGAAFVVGGAFGLSPDLIRSADHRLALSSLTLPHDLARLVLAEQLYRAGTIIRNEPYHKAVDDR